ncbi:hypothetical protein MKEN_01456100 [Mycena kentingensis (nom. inval.)]|nr:hypothetical protein MKEN_01456100 [Mycena kentingensis (nom. inval.)]
MAARRQASTTSLSKFARSDPVPHDRSADFCNAFWGIADGGVDVLFARMRGAMRTMDELRNFWKERANIEDDYARRLAKLSKQTLGRDEIGDLRTSLDAIRSETERQAASHQELAQKVRSDLEGQASAFYAKQQHHKKTYQSGIEKEFKAKQLQEGYVAKAREKYETDCMRINSYTAQLGLVQGKDAERIHLKLERTQSTVAQNERDFMNFARALEDTVGKWEQDWKVFCDCCQDLEDDRIEFMKDNMWAYANAVSTTCVNDDESCEKIRLALEQMEPERDQENFVRSYGTGNQIPDPPPFVDYTNPHAIPSASARTTYRVANFPRSSQRPAPMRRSPQPAEPEPEPETFSENSAGVGTVRRGDDPNANGVSRQNTQYRASIVPQQPQPQQAIGSFSPAPPTLPDLSRQTTSAADLSRRPTSTTGADLSRRPTSTSAKPSSYRVPPPDEGQPPIDPTADTYMKVGDHNYKVDLSKDPRQGSSSSQMQAQAGPSKLGQKPGAFDPLAKQMEDLQNASATVRRKSTRRGRIDTSPNGVANGGGNGAGPSNMHRPSSSMSLVAPGAIVPAGSQHQQYQQQQQRSPSPSPNRDYRQSADLVVGSHPSASRPSSPAAQPITAAFMRPQSGPPPGADMVAEVLGDYGQSLPGERKSISRQGSRRGSYAGPSPTHAYNASQSSQMSNFSAGHALTRPPSQGFAGVGAHSRSTSPAPMSRGPSPAPGQMALARAPSPGPAHMARGPSPGPMQQQQQQHMAMSRGPSPGPMPMQHNARQHSQSQGFIAPPPPPSQLITRSPSPNNVGIALDSSGRVMHDEMAQRYQAQQAQSPPQQQHRQSMVMQQQVAPYNPNGPQRRTSYMGGPGPGLGSASVPPPPLQAGPPAPYQQQQHPGYQQQRASPQPSYSPQPYQHHQQVSPPQSQGFQPSYSGGSSGSLNGHGSQRMSTGPGWNQPPPQQQQLVRVGQPQQQQSQQLVRAGAPQQQQLQHPPHMQHQQRRSPSPAPQGVHQKTSDGKWILFYVKALFPYTATIQEEFDFQEGDIIAVTETPEDGWWSGELLDDSRRVPGKHVFPSNFVELFP